LPNAAGSSLDIGGGMDKVKQYRRRAQECCELAAQVTVPDVRVNYEELSAEATQLCGYHHEMAESRCGLGRRSIGYPRVM